MKVISIILFILFSFYGKNNIDWDLYYYKEHIPKALNEVLQIAYKGKFKIANPDEKYNATDVISDKNLPDKQLVFLAQNNENWRLVYKQGGIGLQHILIQCKISEKDSLYDFSISQTSLRLDDNDSISKLLKENKLRIKLIPINYKNK